MLSAAVVDEGSRPPEEDGDGWDESEITGEPPPDSAGSDGARAAEVEEYCRPMRVSYQNPWEGEPVNEEVYTDPKDEWDGGSGSLLVSLTSINSLKGRSALFYRHHEASLVAMDKCRRDYLREHAYLLDQLSRYEHDVDVKLAQEIRQIVERANKTRELAATDPAKVMGSVEGVQNLAVNAGPRGPEDKELEEQLKKYGLSLDDELTARMLLKEIREKTMDLVQERDRLRKIYAPLEGMERNNPAESLRNALEEENVPLEDALYMMREMERTEKGRGVINDAITDNIRLRYEKAVLGEQEQEAEVMKNRGRLALEETLAGKACALKDEIAAEELRHEEQAELLARQRAHYEEEQELLMKQEILDSMTEDDPLVEQEARVKQIEDEAATMMREAISMERACERDQIEREQLRERIAEAQAAISGVADVEAEAHRRYKAAEEEAERWRQEMLAEEAVAEAVLDEYNAAIMPPPNLKEIHKLEHEIEEMRIKNEQTRAEEANIFAREQLYRKRVQKAQAAWEEHEAEMRAAEQRRKEELRAEKKVAAAGLRSKKQLDDDPYMLDYNDRQLHPVFSNASRLDLLHRDSVARRKRASAKATARLAKVSANFISAQSAINPDLFLRPEAEGSVTDSAASVSVQQAELAGADGNIIPPHIAPLNFRRPEDLRVRSAGFKRLAGLTTHRIEEYEMEADAATAGMLKAQQELSESINRTIVCQEELSETLGPLQHGRLGGQREEPYASLAKELAATLAMHETVLLSASEVWHLAEHICTSCGEAPTLGLLPCVPEEEQASNRSDTALDEATMVMCQSAARIVEADSNSGDQRSTDRELVAWAEECCATYQASEPLLFTARASRESAWTEMNLLAEQLSQHLQVQESLESLREEQEKNQELLQREAAPMTPPPEKRRLASMRAEMRSSPLMESGLRAARPPPSGSKDGLHAPEAVAGKAASLNERRHGSPDSREQR